MPEIRRLKKKPLFIIDIAWVRTQNVNHENWN